MATKTFEATVKLSNGSNQTVQVQADSAMNAKAMMESQYGKVIVGPIQV